MYIVAIAWLYVAPLMAATEPSITGGVLTFLFYGLLPCTLLLWLIGAPQRRRGRSTKISQQHLDQPDGTDPQRNE
ncbi:MAG: hypothetical protein N2Z69_09430 [Methylophilaceae bacterium]|nr:hypothetical protein [Methylophilaceae bacterium]